MEFSCEQCGTRYAVPDEKVRGKRVRTRCRKCNGDIVIVGPGAPLEIPKPPRMPSLPSLAAVTAPRTEDGWTVALSRSEQRKMTTTELVDAYAAGVVKNDTLVWKQGMEKWERPGDIPALELALGLGRPKPPKESVPEPPKPRDAAAAKPADPLASDWDDENEATRVSEGAIPFIARRMMSMSTPEAPQKRPALPRPTPPPRPPTRPPVPPAPKKAVAIAPLMNVAIGPAPVAPPVQPKRDPDLTPPSAPSASDFNFNDEATAVIAPDRAKALLESEAAKSENATATPTALGFEDESTQVLEPDRADALLHGEAAKRSSDAPPAAVAVPPAAPPTASPLPAGFPEPSIVVESEKLEPPMPVPPPRRQLSDPKVPVDPKDVIHTFQNEPTRVVQRVKPKGGRQIWIVVGLALIAAMAAGFIASELLARHAPPAPPPRHAP